MRRRSPVRRSAAAGAVAVALLAGCGGGAGEPGGTSAPTPSTTPGAELYRDLDARMVEAGTAVFVFSGAGGGRTMSGAGEMRFGPAGYDADVRLTMPETGQVRAVLAPTVSYLALPAAKGLPRSRPWVRVSSAPTTRVGRDLQPVVDQLRASFDPTQSLGLLRFGGRVAEAGPATVEGVPTTHYRASVSLRRATRHAAPPARAQYQSMLDAGATHLDVEVWVDTTGLPRRFRVDLPTAEGVFSLTGIYRQWGSSVKVAAPKPKQVFDSNALEK